jgi:hypothetical protein
MYEGSSSEGGRRLRYSGITLVSVREHKIMTKFISLRTVLLVGFYLFWLDVAIHAAQRHQSITHILDMFLVLQANRAVGPCSECVNRLAGIECGCSATSSFLTYGVSNATFALHSLAFLKEPLTHSRDYRVRLQHELSPLAELCFFPSE